MQRELLTVPLPGPEDETFLGVARVKQATAAAVLGTTTKLQENAFQREKASNLNKLLASLRAGEIPTFLDGETG